MRIEIDQIAERPHEQDQPRTAAGMDFGVGRARQSLGDLAQLPEQRAPARKDRAKDARDGLLRRIYDLRKAELTQVPRPHRPQ